MGHVILGCALAAVLSTLSVVPIQAFAGFPGEDINRYPCPPGAHYYAKGQYCIQLFYLAKTWQNARMFCQCEIRGGDLVQLSNADVNNFFIDVLKKATQGTGVYWIGLHDRQSEGQYRWLEGWNDPEFTYWQDKQPDNLNNEDCVRVNSSENFRWNDIECVSLLHFACQLPLTLAQPLSCPLGWTLYPGEGRCFKVEGQAKSWHSAQKTCQDQAGDLAAITSSGVDEFVSGLLSPDGIYWIGLHDQVKEKEFRMVGSTRMASYSNWQSGEPNNYSDEDCTTIESNRNFKWNDLDCAIELEFICERWVNNIEPCRRGSFFYPVDETCIKLVYKTSNWYKAQDICRDERGDLVKLADAGINDFVVGLLQRYATFNRYWIGLNDRGREGVFKWNSENDRAVFTYWREHEPNNLRGENCVEIWGPDRGNRWNDAACKTGLPFVCQSRSFLSFP